MDRSQSRSAAESPALSVRNLAIDIRLRTGIVTAVKDVSLDVQAGETVVVLGESGSGKSLTAMSMMGLLPERAWASSGEVIFGTDDLLSLDARGWRRVRGPGMAMVFQDSLAALNPVQSIGAQLTECFRVHLGSGRREARARAIDILARVGIPDPAGRLSAYPHQFSGGMRQRVMIAMAIALRPKILIADEPTTALDVTVQAQILELFESLVDEIKMGLVLITHDLGVAAQVADRVIVMYAGRIVEEGPADQVLESPMHPYTAALLSSVPSAETARGQLTAIKGSPPLLSDVPQGCSFAPRCLWASTECLGHVPSLADVAPSRAVACHNWREFANEWHVQQPR
ncbi:ABC transporter ATP-binding protein [Phytohabitans kaempferiae]|uniref:ABC transporter ATP-binding protein n=1 Tax=Phytohabitans kaempferiae TaxID=1620943 RepID=A0ABV6MHQ6_9ACTN